MLLLAVAVAMALASVAVHLDARRRRVDAALRDRLGPRGVRIARHDGTEVPVVVRACMGRNADGLSHWQVVLPCPFLVRRHQ